MREGNIPTPPDHPPAPPETSGGLYRLYLPPPDGRQFYEEFPLGGGLIITEEELQEAADRHWAARGERWMHDRVCCARCGMYRFRHTNRPDEDVCIRFKEPDA